MNLATLPGPLSSSSIIIVYSNLHPCLHDPRQILEDSVSLVGDLWFSYKLWTTLQVCWAYLDQHTSRNTFKNICQYNWESHTKKLKLNIFLSHQSRGLGRPVLDETIEFGVRTGGEWKRWSHAFNAAKPCVLREVQNRSPPEWEGRKTLAGRIRETSMEDVATKMDFYMSFPSSQVSLKFFSRKKVKTK